MKLGLIADTGGAVRYIFSKGLNYIRNGFAKPQTPIKSGQIVQVQKAALRHWPYWRNELKQVDLNFESLVVRMKRMYQAQQGRIYGRTPVGKMGKITSLVISYGFVGVVVKEFNPEIFENQLLMENSFNFQEEFSILEASSDCQTNISEYDNCADLYSNDWSDIEVLKEASYDGFNDLFANDSSDIEIIRSVVSEGVVSDYDKIVQLIRTLNHDDKIKLMNYFVNNFSTNEESYNSDESNVLSDMLQTAYTQNVEMRKIKLKLEKQQLFIKQLINRVQNANNGPTRTELDVLSFEVLLNIDDDEQESWSCSYPPLALDMHQF